MEFFQCRLHSSSRRNELYSTWLFGAETPRTSFDLHRRSLTMLFGFLAHGPSGSLDESKLWYRTCFIHVGVADTHPLVPTSRSSYTALHGFHTPSTLTHRPGQRHYFVARTLRHLSMGQIERLPLSRTTTKSPLQQIPTLSRLSEIAGHQ